MKTLGLMGGTGWVSTIEYYRLINTGINKRLGGLNAARLMLYSFNYGEIDAFNKTNNQEAIFKMVLDAASKLSNAGCDGLMLCANTLHMFAGDLQQEIPLPLIHIGEATAQAIKNVGLKKVALLGTKYTMEMDFYHSKLAEAQIEAIVPQEKDKEFVHQSIMTELLMDKFLPETKSRFREIIAGLVDQGAEGVVLGCTEIPLLISQQDIDIPVFNTTEIHALAAVEFALQE